MSIDSPSIDPGKAVVSYSYQWHKDNVLQVSQLSATIAAADTTAGEVWTVTVVPNNGIADGPAATATALVQNSAPTINSVLISPVNGVTNDQILSCSAVVVDADEFLIANLEWSIGGTTVGSGSSLDLAAVGAVPAQTVMCIASAETQPVPQHLQRQCHH